MNSQKYYSTTPIYTSRRVERVAVGCRDYVMSFGDRMSVRATIGGETIDYETSSVADMTDLVGDLRLRLRGKRGLAVMSIRNRDRGWARERRIMLYPERSYAPAQKVSALRPRAIMPWDL